MTSSIDMDRSPPLGDRRSLVVLFVPSVERDGATPVDQEEWVTRALHTFGALFGGATAYPKARGVWRDDERGGTLVFDDPVIIHSYVRRSDLEDDARMSQLGAFCRVMGRETRQGEIGLIVDGEYLPFRHFEEHP